MGDLRSYSRRYSLSRTAWMVVIDRAGDRRPLFLVSLLFLGGGGGTLVANMNYSIRTWGAFTFFFQLKHCEQRLSGFPWSGERRHIRRPRPRLHINRVPPSRRPKKLRNSPRLVCSVPISRLLFSCRPKVVVCGGFSLPQETAPLNKVPGERRRNNGKARKTWS